MTNKRNDPENTGDTVEEQLDKDALDLEPGQGADTPIPGPAAGAYDHNTVPVTVSEVVQAHGEVTVRERLTVQSKDKLPAIELLPDNSELSTRDQLSYLEMYIAQGGTDQTFILRELGQAIGKIK